mgnify:FL=1
MDIADILIHVHPDLPVDARAGLEEGLRGFDGVISAHFNQQHGHLLVVAYNPDLISSAQVLEHVGERGVEASKIGL